jgi:hypothetical protein
MKEEKEGNTMLKLANMVSTCCVLGLLATGGLSSANAKCSELENKDAPELLKYLSGDRAKLAPECILYALENFGERRYEPAAKILISYLDFRRPVELAFSRPLPASPAESGLFLLGRPVVPLILEAMTASDSSDLMRASAANVIYAIHGSTPEVGIAMIKRAGDRAQDPILSQKLLESAVNLARRCHPSNKNACESAAMISK